MQIRRGNARFLMFCRLRSRQSCTDQNGRHVLFHLMNRLNHPNDDHNNDTLPSSLIQKLWVCFRISLLGFPVFFHCSRPVHGNRLLESSKRKQGGAAESGESSAFQSRAVAQQKRKRAEESAYRTSLKRWHQNGLLTFQRVEPRDGAASNSRMFHVFLTICDLVRGGKSFANSLTASGWCQENNSRIHQLNQRQPGVDS
jgi:hypothetical protein